MATRLYSITTVYNMEKRESFKKETIYIIERCRALAGGGHARVVSTGSTHLFEGLELLQKSKNNESDANGAP